MPGLNVGSQSTACSSQPSGLVSAQSPVSGTNVQPNTSVNLVVSSGSCVSVPGVVGQSQSAATSAITGAGLVANTTFDTSCPGGAQPGNVDSQTPAASAQVNSGSTVNISVCQSATTTTTTSTTTPSSTTTSTAPGPPSNSRPGAPGRLTAAGSSGQVGGGDAELAEEVGQQGRARHGQDRLGVELHPLDAQRAVAQPHDHAVGRGGRHLQLVGHRVGAAPPASGSAWRRRGWGGRRRSPGRRGGSPRSCRASGAGPPRRCRRRTGRCTGGPGRRPAAGSPRPAPRWRPGSPRRPRAVPVPVR